MFGIRNPFRREPDIPEDAKEFVESLGKVTILENANDPALDSRKTKLREVAHIGGKNPLWIGAQNPQIRGSAKAQTPVFVNYFTKNTPYEEIANRLRGTLEKFNLEYRIVELDTRGSWERNIAAKADVVEQFWYELRRPIVWTDADSTLESYPELMMNCIADFAISKTRGWEFGAGTFYIGNSEYSKRLLDHWVLRCKADPDFWDQMHLDAAWADLAAVEPIKTLWLPQPYFAIFDHEPQGQPVFKHWQASRKHKAEMSGGVAQPKPHLPDALQHARLYSRYKRTPETLFWVHSKPGDEEFGRTSGDDNLRISKWIAANCGEHASILEVGCGYGHLAKAFDPKKYIGVDVDPRAILAAAKSNPDHIFRLFTEELDYPATDLCFFSNLLRYVPDITLRDTLSNAAQCTRRILIVERAESVAQEKAGPSVFWRDKSEYIRMMEALGFSLSLHEGLDGQSPFNCLLFERRA